MCSVQTVLEMCLIKHEMTYMAFQVTHFQSFMLEAKNISAVAYKIDKT